MNTLEQLIEKYLFLLNPQMSLFQLIETLKNNGIAFCDPKLLSIIIEYKHQSFFKNVHVQSFNNETISLTQSLKASIYKGVIKSLYNLG